MKKEWIKLNNNINKEIYKIRNNKYANIKCKN